MPLVVEDGSGRTDANSYISVEDANKYFQDLPNAAWGGKTDEQKGAALIRATRFLDGRYGDRWVGVASTGAQALGWPRDDIPDQQGDTQGRFVLPKALLDVTCEVAALYFVVGDKGLDAPQERALVNSVRKVGPITTSLQFDRSATKGTVYPLISRMVRTLIGGGSRNQVRLVRS